MYKTRSWKAKLDKALVHKVRLDDNGCWIWTGTKDYDGYAIMGQGRKHFRVTRLIWPYFFNIEPGNFLSLHKCNVRACVNIKHLYLGDASDNAKDRWAAVRARR